VLFNCIGLYFFFFFFFSDHERESSGWGFIKWYHKRYAS